MNTVSKTPPRYSRDYSPRPHQRPWLIYGAGRVRTKRLFNLSGSVIVILWLIMIGLLIKKVHDTDKDFMGGLSGETSNIQSFDSDWMEVFLKGEKVGWCVNHISPVQEDYLVEQEIVLALNLMGKSSVVNSVTRCVVGHQFQLKNFSFKMTSGAVQFQVSGKVENNRMSIETGDGRTRRTEIIQLTETPMATPVMSHFFKNRQIQVGQSFSFPVFDPSTMAQEPVTAKVAGIDRLTINGIDYDALRLEAQMWGKNLKTWLDRDGSVLKEEGFMGFTLVRSSAEKARQKIAGGKGGDLYEMAGVRVKKGIQTPDSLNYLKINIKGLEGSAFDSGFLNGGRQNFQGGTLEIVKEDMIKSAGFSIPYTSCTVEMDPFIKPELGIQSDEEQIIEKAHEITGDTTNPVVASRKLLTWVYENIEKRPVVVVPSALEVLKTRTGDCNEHATLLTALLRAVGIPARMCAGLVYMRGMFYYHAWCEIYLGQWLSADPTLNQMPADVSHIRLTTGGTDRQVALIGLVDRIKLEIVAYR
jgi:hypothetical protein